MARPKKLNADWFPHDANERDTPMVKAIRRKYSYLGYAIWNFLQETLTSSDLFRVQWDDVTVELLAADYDVEPEDLSAVVEYAVKIGLLETEDGCIFSPEHRAGLKPLLLKRERDRQHLTSQDGSDSEVIDNDNAPITNGHESETSEKQRKQRDSRVIATDNEVFDVDNTRKHVLSQVIGANPVKDSKSKRNSKSNTHTVVTDWKGGSGENQAAEFLAWLESAFPAITMMAEPLTEEQASDILAKFSAEDINRIIAQIDNKGADKK